MRGRLPPALLLSGPEGVGKKRLAVEACRALLCEVEPAEGCGACSSCRRVAGGIHPDVFVVEPDTPSSIKIEQIRDLVLQIQTRPFEAKYRAFVIDDAHLLTEQASNALLKGLEEPPSTSHVILVTSAPHALLPTIRSRCQALRARSLPPSTVESFLMARGIAPAEARLRALVGGGSIGRALALDSDAYRTLREDMLRALEVLSRGDDLGALSVAERLEESDDPILALGILRSLLRDVQALALGAPAANLVNVDVAAPLAALAGGRLGISALRLAESAGRTRAALEGRDGALRRGIASRPLALSALLDVMRP